MAGATSERSRGKSGTAPPPTRLVFVRPSRMRRVSAGFSLPRLRGAGRGMSRHSDRSRSSLLADPGRHYAPSPLAPKTTERDTWQRVLGRRSRARQGVTPVAEAG